MASQEVSRYEQALALLRSQLRFGIDPKLETVQDMFAYLGNPDAAFRSIQIAGTNGKTSTSRYTAAILTKLGYRTALYTSPELVSYTERMEINGQPVTQEQFAWGIEQAYKAGRAVNAQREQDGLEPYSITEFDLLTVAAACIFAEAKVEVCVLECGLGGRWDATSAFSSIEVVGITGVGLDHMHILGDTLEAIAAEKAAIIKPNRACVLGCGTLRPASVLQVFLDAAAQAGVEPILVVPQDATDAPYHANAGEFVERSGLSQARFHITAHPERLGFPVELTVETPNASYPELAALKPSYQAANIAMAVVLAQAFVGTVLPWQQVYDAVVACPTPGRFELMRPAPLTLIDACHNPQSVKVFLTAVRAIEPHPSKRPALLLAALADKDVHTMVALLVSEFPAIFVTQTASPRALPASELAQIVSEHKGQVQAVYASVDEAVQELSETPFIACGSITLAGELRAHYKA